MKILVAFVLIIIGLTALPESQIEGQVLAQVSSEKSVKWDATQEYCLAQNIYFEAGNQSLEGMAAVADVTLNRVQNPSYPNDICSVVKQGIKHPNGAMKRNMCQFSWYCDGQSDKVLTYTKAWENAQYVAKVMLAEKDNYLGITSGSTHYHATYVAPDWIYDRGMSRVTQIGSHIFYKFW